MKKLLGLDLGTNSIGWALVENDFDQKSGKIIGLGSRIIPMSQDKLGDFGKGNSVSQTAERTSYRSVRRLRERHLLRRERLHRVLNVLNFLPEHYRRQIDFTHHPGKFIEGTEPKISIDSGKFLFMNSFREMLSEFENKHPDLIYEDKKIPYDWTLYYLRKKAIRGKLEKEELAWLILNFNQKRGYYQARGEEESEKTDKKSEYYSLTITDVKVEEDTKPGRDPWYSIILENGWVYRRQSRQPLFEWVGKVKNFIVTTELNVDGTEKTDKDGNVKRSFRAPSDDDWTLLKKKSENEIEMSGLTVGEYIYNKLLENPSIKIKGQLIRTIERKYYKDELLQILSRQAEYHPEFQNEQVYVDCVRELYRNNQAHRDFLSSRNLIHLIIEDIIFYQRPLKSKKGMISVCSLEYKKYVNKDGNDILEPIPCVSKSNPIYQEFRLWQWIRNLSIYNKENGENVTSDVIHGYEEYAGLFEFLNERKEIKETDVLKFLFGLQGHSGKILKSVTDAHRWNYVEDKVYPGNETKYQMVSRLDKAGIDASVFLNSEKEYALWHIIYSVSDKKEYEKALATFAKKYGIQDSGFVDTFKKHPPYKSDYGAFSEKAIKKLLPLMRMGSYWDWEKIDLETKSRIAKLLSGEVDDDIKERLREQTVHLNCEEEFQGLPVWLAQYIVYGRKSETGKWKTPAELDAFIEEFRQHSLRNPIVEQVILEALRVVRDIWAHYGNAEPDYFDEIHLELGRDLKNPKAERERMTKELNENEATNVRIKTILAELAGYVEVENVRPHSPMQQEILKIYESGVLNSGIEIDDEILKISKTAQPSPADVRKYKLWLEQRYRSPYTGEIIPLNKLFTTEYEIEHIFPQSRYFDDSFSNKVICEAAVNKLKDNQLAYEFIKNHAGEIVNIGFGRTVKIFSETEFKDFVTGHYANSRSKLNKLLADEIPDKMIQSQLNDTRYISRFIAGVLSNIVRAPQNDDGLHSKNLIFVTGKITSTLKKDWGLNDIWNDLLLPRFKRLNAILNTDKFTAWSENHQKYIPAVPLEYSQGFSKKRLDHRHHALDALVIACASRNHVNLLSNLNAITSTRYDLNRKLRFMKKVSYMNPRSGEKIEREVPDQFIKPWPSFTADASEKLNTMIVSFKQNVRVINKAVNSSFRWVNQDGQIVKKRVKQAGTNWAVRKPLHKETVSGKVDLPRIKVPKGKILSATRRQLDTSFDSKTIDSITDTGIQKILRNYLASRDNKPEVAFTPEGIEDMNRNIGLYNSGKPHKPIQKVRVFELGSKFPLGTMGNKQSKYVEAAKGTNLFFGVYEGKSGVRKYESIALNDVVERLKQGLHPVPEINAQGESLLFYLSPNDLVRLQNDGVDAVESLGSIYKVISFSGSQLFLIPHTISVSIIYKQEFSVKNKMERSVDGKMIKEICIPLLVNRLGLV